MQLAIRHVVAVACACAACDDTVSGQQPIGGAVDTDAEIQRYLRRAYLDLTGAAPAESDLTAATARLRDGANTAAVRGALVDELVGAQAYARLWAEELENSIFGGATLDDQYAFVCGVIRSLDDTCSACTATDSCACACNELPTYLAERESLRTTPDDFGAGTATGELERRYALAYGYYVLAGSPEGRVRTLFDDFLARPAEPDEIENGRSMIFGAIIPGSPAGLMFHRHGATYDDLIDIVFDSEVYREAIVRRTFERYLARGPSAAELAHFVPTLDANDPDARSLVRAVVSAREYFEQ